MTIMDNLISLAMIDEEIKEIESSKGDLPLRIEKLENEKKDINGSKKTLNDQLKELSDKQNKLNRNKEDSDTSLKKSKDQLYLVKNNREYDALNTEIDIAKENLFKISEELLAINEEKEEIEEQSKLNKSNINECNKKLVKYNAQLKNVMSTDEKKYKKLISQKEKLIDKLDKDILKNYNRMFDAKGYGVVSISGNACNACYTILPPQLITEVKEKNNFKYCPSCNILLYFED